MYSKLKNLVKKILPRRMLSRYEKGLRRLASFPYRGSTYQCNICDFRLSRFVTLPNGERLCPRCGSLPRTRRLHQMLHGQIALAGKRVLHFSPPAALADRIGRSEVEEYVTTDYAGEFSAQKNLDITDMAEPDEAYDLIICYHVLEHVENDQQAMRELYRVLKKDGVCLIQTPFKDGDIYEDPTIRSAAERLVHFGQEDHVRIYSPTGLQARLERVGFEVKILKFHEPEKNRFGYKEQEKVLLAIKKENTPGRPSQL